MNDYQEFLATKRIRVASAGVDVSLDAIHPVCFDFQRDITRWALHKGRCAVFADTGLGKTPIQLEWARLTGENALIIAPLSVARQTAQMGRDLLDLDVHYVRSQEEVTHKNTWITNYEMIDHFDFSKFGAVVLDESSILKALTGKTRRKLVEYCAQVPYRSAYSATPAPNDWIELGNHCEFLGICTMAEMLAMFFINANKEHTYDIGGRMFRRKGTNKGGQEWRLKHHAEEPFFAWLSTWAMCLTKPSDLGYDDTGFDLPSLNIHTHYVDVNLDKQAQSEGLLFHTGLGGIQGRSRVRKETIQDRLSILAGLVDDSDDQWIVWCGLNAESKAATAALPGAVEVKGSDSAESKAQAFEDFQDGKFRVMVTKGKIAGLGMNFQNAHKMAFMGLNDSWEMWYQCIRREWRFMQEHPVDVHVILAELEAPIYENIQRKDAQASRLRAQMIAHMRDYEKGELLMQEQEAIGTTNVATMRGENWTAMLGDSCERLKEIETDSIDLSVYSPPFADLYTYSNSERDLGNCRDWPEFFEHYAHIIREVLRVTKPGRLTCVHTSDLPALAQKDGYIGIKNFPGAVIDAYEKEGWILHGRAFVQKNPQAQAIRTHAKALLFVQMDKDSSHSRPALIDQILIFKKDGENKVPVRPVENGELDNEVWINWANGIWTDISESDTLQFSRARDGSDEKHICPLQLGTIERCVKLYSNPGETVLSPFGGIGSEGYVALRNDRKAVLIELKPSYFTEMIRNLQKAQSQPEDMFSAMGIDVPEAHMTRMEII
jgi:DNA modification methylase